MTRRNHAIEIADAQWEERARIAADMAQIEAIEQAGERRAAKVAQQPREAIIRLAQDHGRYVRFHVTVTSDRPKPAPTDWKFVEFSDRPPLLRRLVWPGVLLCALGLALMGVR